MSKLPPFSNRTIIDYEKCLLGAYILGAPIAENITESVFCTSGHRAIFPVIRKLKENGLDLDVSILVNELEKKNKIDTAGGIDYVAGLTSGVNTANKTFYEAEVLEAHRGRTIHRAATLAKESLERGKELETVNTELLNSLEPFTRTTTGSSQETGILFCDLLKKEFPPENWIVEELITTGLTVLTGSIKIGKSFAALQLITALDQGGYFMGTLKADKCDVLYCALEDTEKRIQKRIKKHEIYSFNGSRLETKRRTVEDLRAFLKANEQYRVVIVDTFQKMMGITDLNDYAKTVNGMSALKAIADDLNRAIVVIHHNRKSSDIDGDHMESALGSTGINATADCTITLRRKRGDELATMQVSGRDVEDTSYSLRWDKHCCSFTIAEKAELKPTLPEAQQEIIDILGSEDRNWTNAEIIEKTEKSKQAVSNLLSRMKEIGLILNPYPGQWRSKTEYTCTLPLRECVQVYSPAETESTPEKNEAKRYTVTGVTPTLQPENEAELEIY